MKKLFSLAIIYIISLNAFSQVKASPGLRGGINISNITNSYGDSKTDFYIGGFIGIKLVRFYTLQPELTYSRQGGNQFFYSIDNGFDPNIAGFNSFDENLEIQYLNLSIANKFHPIPEVGLNFILGPSFNIKVADNYDRQNDNITGFDFALFAGIGYEFPFGLGFEARYNQGLIDIFGYESQDDNEDFEWDELYLNSYFQVGATYKFDF